MLHHAPLDFLARKVQDLFHTGFRDFGEERAGPGLLGPMGPPQGSELPLRGQVQQSSGEGEFELFRFRERDIQAPGQIVGDVAATYR